MMRQQRRMDSRRTDDAFSTDARMDGFARAAQIGSTVGGVAGIRRSRSILSPSLLFLLACVGEEGSSGCVEVRERHCFGPRRLSGFAVQRHVAAHAPSSTQHGRCSDLRPAGRSLHAANRRGDSTGGDQS